MPDETQSTTILGYTLVNPDKLTRAIDGAVTRDGGLVGGVGREASDEAKLAAYDRLGGLIKKGAYKVKMGSFYDFKGRKPHANPKPLLVFRDLNNNEVELEEGEPLPIEVRAAEMIKENKTKAVKTKKASKKSDEDTDDEE